MGKRPGVAGKVLLEPAAVLIRAVAERVASNGLVGAAAEVLEAGSVKVPFVGMSEGSKLRGRVTRFSQCSFRISMFEAAGSLACWATELAIGIRHKRSIQLQCRAKRPLPSKSIAKNLQIVAALAALVPYQFRDRIEISVTEN
jgi:hypothetical protein